PPVSRATYRARAWSAGPRLAPKQDVVLPAKHFSIMPRERVRGKGSGRHSAEAMDVTMPRPETTKRFDPAPRQMDRAAFVAKFGAVYEHFPQVAENVWARGLDASTDTPAGLAAAMADVAAALSSSEKLKLIRNHPDLAGRVAIGELTASSR